MRTKSRIPEEWENIGEELTERAMEQLGVGDILRFKDDDGKITELKIMRMKKSQKHCWVKKTKTYTMQEIDEMAKRNNAAEK